MKGFMNNRRIFVATVGLFGLSAILVLQTTKTISHKTTIAEDATYNLVISSANQNNGGMIYNESGYGIYFKADSSSGITWNNGSNKMVIAQHGYLENQSAINGIKSVTVNLVYGSVSLYHDWKQPTDLETAEYGEDFTFTTTSTYTYTDIAPSRFRIIANTQSVIDSIVVKYSCSAGAEDETIETIDYGLENGYFDSGSIGRYARTSYVTSDTCDAESKRSLKLTFNGVTNNYVSLSTQKNTEKGLVTSNPDFSHTRLTFKAKFSENCLNQDISVCPMGSSWEHPGYITANKSSYYDHGWYSYSLDLSNYEFANRNNGIRINIKPLGVDSTNKETAWVLLDDIKCEYTSGLKSTQGSETALDSLENMVHDTGWETTTYQYDYSNTFGQNSKNSLLIRPNTNKSQHYQMKWNTILNIGEAATKELFKEYNLSSVLFKFNYNTFNTNSPSSFVLGVIQGWDNSEQTIVTLDGMYLYDGWYEALVDLSTLNILNTNTIRLSLGWDISSDKVTTAKVWIDNLTYVEEPGYETLSEGWENMVRDSGWDNLTVTRVISPVANEVSKNSLKCQFSSFNSNSNANFVCFSPQNQGVSRNASSVTLQAKFMFTNNIIDKTIRLVLVDGDWNAARYNIPVIALGNGWYQLTVDLATVSQYIEAGISNAGFSPANIIRFGFGFLGVTSANVGSATIWVDDVFLTNGTPSYASASTYSKGVIWQAYDNELVKRDATPTSGRNISSTAPLYFEGLKNENEGTQLVVDVKGTSGINQFNFRAPNLYSETGGRILSSNIDISVAKYINVPSNSAQHNKTGWPGTGYYPDALVPIDNIISANENSIPGGSYSYKHVEQTIWVNVKIPEDINSGTYTGEGVLTLDGVDYAIPMKVVVHKAVVPTYRTNKNMYLLWWDQVEKALGSEHYNSYTRANFYNFYIDKGVGAGCYREGDWGSTPENYAKFYGAAVASNDKINCYRSPFHDGPVSYQEIYDCFDAMIDENIEMVQQGKDVNFFDKFVTYHDDEPDTPEKWASTLTFDTDFHNAINALKDKLNDYPELKESFINQRCVCPYNRDIEDVDFNALTNPAPTYDYLDTEYQRETYHENFEHVWWYGCILPYLPYPTFQLDGSLTGIRMLTYMQYNYDIEGSIYWNLCYCQRKDNVGDPYDVDLWTDPLTWGNGSCDGRLSYPGTKYGILGPITTQRLEEIVASFEDYEYFVLIEQKLGSREEALELISNTMHFSSFFNGTQLTISTTNNKNFVTYRQNLLNIIDGLY